MRVLGKTILVGFLTAIGVLSVSVPAVRAAATAPADAAQVRNRILVLYDENKDDLPGLARTDRSLRESFRAELGNAVEIHSESMGISRSARAGYDSLVAEFYRSKYAGLKPDLIIAVMETPLDFLLRYGDTMFPRVPIVFASIDASTIKGKTLPGNVTGVLLKRTYSPTLEVVLRLQPETRNVFVVGGAAPFDRFLQTFVRRDLQPFEGRVGINYLFGMTMDDLLKRLSSLPAHSAILHVSLLRDGAGRRFVPADALSSIAASANAPVYVFLDQYVGLGAVGGNVYSFVTHGAQVAALGLQILRGASPASLPIRELSAQVNLFDARQLRRWKLDEARLPPGSEVRYRDQSVWMLYRWYIIAAITVLVTQGALIGGLLVARTRQRRAEAEARQQRDNLAHVLRVTTLGELTASLAHEIRQPLTAILANAQAASRFLGSGQPWDPKDVKEALTDIMASVGRASLVIERLWALFRKERVERAAVDVKALIEDVVRLLHSAMIIGHIDIRLRFGEAVPAISGDPVQLEQVLLNVVINACEAIAARKDGSRVITIHTRRNRPGHVLIEVADSGVGLENAELEHIFEHFVSTKPKGLGMGLAISRSIINAHGGRIWATANTDCGLTVHIELPCSSETRNEAGTAAEMA
jgi:signal transduction histidine kinase